MLKYIYANVEKIKKPNDVNVIKPIRNGGTISLWAMLNNGEDVQLTDYQSVLTFPFSPILEYGLRELGRRYFENFATIDNVISINKNHLTRLGYIDTNEKRISTCAYFDDGRIVRLYKPTKKDFLKKYKPEMEQKFGMQFEDITEEIKQQNELNQ